MFVEWWNMLDAATQVFYCIAIPATLVLLVQTVLIFIGFGDSGDGIDDVGLEDAMDGISDTHVGEGIFGEDGVTEIEDASAFDGLRIFTVRGIVAFFVVFGWVGVALRSAGVGLLITIPAAFLSGAAAMVGIAYLLRAVLKLRSDGTADNRNAVGAHCKVHLTVPPARSGAGKVHVMLQGSYVERNAVTDDDSPIPTGSEAVVVGTSGETDLVIARK